MRHEWIDAAGIKHFVDDSLSTGPMTVEFLRLAARVQELEAELSQEKGTIIYWARLKRRIAELEADNLSLVNDLEAEGVRIEALARENRELREPICSFCGSDLKRGPGVSWEPCALCIRSNVLLGENRAAGEMLQARQDTIRGLESRLQATLDSLALANETARLHARRIDHLQEVASAFQGVATRSQSRLAKLDALLASEEPPHSLRQALYIGAVRASATDLAWRWFRETLEAGGSPRPGATVKMTDQPPPTGTVADIGFRRWTDGEGNEWQQKVYYALNEPVTKDSDFIRPTVTPETAPTGSFIFQAKRIVVRYRFRPANKEHELFKWRERVVEEEPGEVCFLEAVVDQPHISPPSEQTSASPESERRSSPPPATPESEP